MSRTLEQKIADAEARLQRLKAKSRSLDTAQKVIVGAALLAKVRKPEEVQLRARLLQFLKAEVTRQADVTRILPLINELEALPDSDCIVRSPQSQRPSVSERVGEEAEVNPSPD
ncbi:mobilization protein [Escherichia coli]|uniref:mobilization protein n=1 Tax=Escherichia coli TaxID=562 RepID=UPI00388FD8B6